MSYDISFRVKVEGIDRYVDVGDCTANIAKIVFNCLFHFLPPNQ